MCVLFRLPRPSTPNAGGAVDAGGAEGSSGNSLNIGGARWGASGDLIANVIDILPWDTPTALGGVSRTSILSLSASGVTVVLSRLGLTAASRA